MVMRVLSLFDLDKGNKFIYNFVYMVTSKTIRTVTDMRKDADGLLEFVALGKKPVGIFRHNKLEAYLVDPETLEALETFVEDYLDTQLVENRLNAKKDFRDFETFWENKKLPK